MPIIPETPRLSVSHVSILHCLKRNSGGLTREQLLERSGATCSYDVLGPAYGELIDKYPGSLVAMGYVSPAKYTPTDPTIFSLTEKGIEAAGMYKTRRLVSKKDKIPDDELGNAVKQIRALRAYGFELFTDDDIKEVRSLLQEEHRGTNIPSIRQQIVNLRKRGGFKEGTEEPKWYVTYRNSKEGRLFAAKVLEFYGGCTINPKDSGDIKVYHRTFYDKDGNHILGLERVKDGIALCHRCWNRQARFLCQIPENDPSEVDTPDDEEYNQDEE